MWGTLQISAEIVAYLTVKGMLYGTLVLPCNFTEFQLLSVEVAVHMQDNPYFFLSFSSYVFHFLHLLFIFCFHCTPISFLRFYHLSAFSSSVFLPPSLLCCLSLHFVPSFSIFTLVFLVCCNLLSLYSAYVICGQSQIIQLLPGKWA